MNKETLSVEVTLKLAREALTADGWKKAGDAIRAIDELLVRLKACPDQERDEYTCKNRHQCWEPCGELGKSEQHAQAIHPTPSDYKALANLLRIKHGIK